jgi:hypothetical protein
MFRRMLLSAVVVGACAAVPWTASALASTVTVGPSLTGTYQPFVPEEQGTFTNPTLEAGANVTSPVTGTIVCWRITDTTGGPITLRVLTPDGGNTYTGAGTSAPQTSTGVQTQSFATNLQIRAGQAIGIDDSTVNDQQLVGIQFGYRLDVGSHLAWTGSLADGSTRASTTPQEPGEFGFNATVQTSGPNLGCGGGGGGGGTPPPPKHCVVPKVNGDKLTKAKKRLKAADCRLGKVTGHGKKVKKERPKVGTVLPARSKVNIKLG